MRRHDHNAKGPTLSARLRQALRLGPVLGPVLGLVLGLACGDPEGESATTEIAPSTGGCPDAGGSMMRLPEGFCVDRTEVTRGAYFAWLETEPAIAEQSASCTGNDDFLPTCFTTGAWGFDRFLENPVGCVDWCDAQAFCSAHGKRMCGGLGGGSNPFDQYADADKSEWFAACSSAGQFDYVYGNDYVKHACYESPEMGWGTTASASFVACESPEPDYAGVYDLGGNVAEWEDSCDDSGPDGRCRIRGGSFKHNANGTRCDAGLTLSLPRTATDDAVGFRCCAD